jgi:hypothetical protein
MIPTFPEFKVVDVSDRAAVEAHTHRFPPYSDFNFTSLWAWDTSGERMISELNGNLVVRFTDYSTHEPFLSFLGENEPEHTARTLIDYCKTEGLPTTLKLVPEISVKDIRPSVLKVEEDRDNFDYIYSITELSALRGVKFSSKRNLANRFRREHSGMRIETVSLNDPRIEKNVLTIIDRWEKNKLEHGKEYEVEHERTAIKRLLGTADAHELLVTAVFLRDSMNGFSILERLPKGYCIEHFWKTDVAQRGAFDILMQEQAMHLETLGDSFLNFEQDLGFSNMRTSKMAFRPAIFLQKYKIRYT